jgi:hypothetical protein
MPRNITSEVLEAMIAQQSSAVYLIRADFSKPYDNPPYEEIVYVTNAGQNIMWRDAAGDPQVYIGAGELLDVSFLEENSELQSYSATINFSGVELQNVVRALNLKYFNNVVSIYLAYLDEHHDIIDDPVLIFAGRMDQFIVNVGSGTATISMTVSSRFSDWEIQKGGRYTNAYQQTYYDKEDLGFQYLPIIADIPIRWGDKRVEPTRLG